MRIRALLSLVSVLVIHLLPCAAQQPKPKRNAAQAGDKVWVIVNSVKADKRAQFERFVTAIFWPGAAKLSPAEQRVFRQTRVLNLTAPEADGTYSYLFIMDPLIPGANYEIGHLLQKEYGAAKAAEYVKLLDGSLAGKQHQYLMVQTKNKEPQLASQVMAPGG